jgi:hypothetical protein
LAVSDTRLQHLPIFPLPRAQLFPGTLLPLHVFEPRYRAMLDYVLDQGERALAIAELDPRNIGADPERPMVLPVVGVGVVVSVQRLEEGRANILLKGTDRARLIDELDEGSPFRFARVQRLTELDAPSGHPDHQRLRGLVARLAMQADEARDALDMLLAHAANPARLTDLVAAHLCGDGAVRRQLLDTLEVEPRLALCCQWVERLLLETAPAPEDEGGGHLN